MSLILTFITSLMLGMRHATDPDHIVAVTTIVARERSVVKAAGIGAIWGAGHTITLLLVGGAIIAFKIAFNARLGAQLIEQEKATNDYYQTQYNVLRILRGSPEGLACGEIGSRMITRDPDITRLLDRLEKRALISRRRETTDRRR